MLIRKKIITILLVLSIMVSSQVQSQVAATKTNSVPGGDLVGRWDLVVLDNGVEKASWLEIEISGFKTLVGRFVASGGSARPISKINYTANKFSFAIPPQWESVEKDLVLEGERYQDGIKGVIYESDGRKLSFTGTIAPDLTEPQKIKWDHPIQLFNGKDLDGWKVDGENQWVVSNGEMISPHSGANIITEQKFSNFKLHIEFKYKKESNSGVYLRGRYETQIIDNPSNAHPNSHLFGGIYGFLVPSKMVAIGPDQWQSFDITLIGRMVTVVANGETIICNQEIPGITGGALDSKEASPGPIYLQGDHGPVSFRRIVITPALK